MDLPGQGEHILNKILKDLVVKYKTMAGFRSPYVPGWDTHGLPIELAVDRELGDRKREMSKVDIRKECETYALKYVDIQRAEFGRLGVFGQWGCEARDVHIRLPGPAPSVFRTMALAADNLLTPRRPGSGYSDADLRIALPRNTVLNQ